MIRSKPAPSVLVAAILPLALALSLGGCGKSDEAAAPSAAGTAPIAKIAPPAGKAWSDVVAVTPEGGYRMGNPDAPIKLVEYGSLTCSHCAEFNKESAAPLRDTFVASGRVSFEFRNFVRDGIDITAAMLVRCGTPDSFFALTEEAFANQAAMFEKVQALGNDAFAKAMALPDTQRFGAIGEIAGLTDFFAARGISRSQAKSCLAQPATANALAKSTEKQSSEHDIQATPTFLINGEKVENARWADLKIRLEAMGAR